MILYTAASTVLFEVFLYVIKYLNLHENTISTSLMTLIDQFLYMCMEYDSILAENMSFFCRNIVFWITSTHVPY